MKIVVLAGGISTERTVSLVSGTGVCQALRRKGHQAILVDMFMGLENPPAACIGRTKRNLRSKKCIRM